MKKILLVVALVLSFNAANAASHIGNRTSAHTHRKKSQPTWLQLVTAKLCCASIVQMFQRYEDIGYLQQIPILVAASGLAEKAIACNRCLCNSDYCIPEMYMLAPQSE